jgi:hypothetical protein
MLFFPESFIYKLLKKLTALPIFGLNILGVLREARSENQRGKIISDSWLINP